MSDNRNNLLTQGSIIFTDYSHSVQNQPTSHSGWQHPPEDPIPTLQSEDGTKNNLDQENTHAEDIGIEFESDDLLSDDLTKAIMREISEESNSSLKHDFQTDTPLLDTESREISRILEQPIFMDDSEDMSQHSVEQLQSHETLTDQTHTSIDSYVEIDNEIGSLETNEEQSTDILPAYMLALPADDQTHHVLPSKDDKVHIEALERWLERPAPKQQQSSNILTIAASILGVAIVGGVFYSFYFNSFFQSPQGLPDHLAGISSVNLSSYSKENITTTNDQSSHRFSNSSGSNDSGSHQGDSKKRSYSSASLITTGPILGSANNKCSEPQIDISSLKGGKSQINISSDCYSNQPITISYSGIEFNRVFDQTGSLEFVLDCFAGDRTPIHFTFNNGKKYTRYPVTDGIDKMSKVAILWESAFDLDIHAFEYSPASNKTTHVWEQKSSSYQDAEDKTSDTLNGHGFISSSSSLSKTSDQKLEVYTYLHSSNQPRRVIKMGLSYKTRLPSQIQNVSCHNSNTNTLNYQTIHLRKNVEVSKSQASLILNDCDFNAQKQIKSKAITDLEIGK